jgi:hypothetical protein
MKKKNNLNRNCNIIVNFYPATEKEIKRLLKSLSVEGFKVSNLIERWSVDVPFWKENYYAEKLLESELVEKIYRNAHSKKIQDQSFVEDVEVADDK